MPSVLFQPIPGGAAEPPYWPVTFWGCPIKPNTQVGRGRGCRSACSRPRARERAFADRRARGCARSLPHLLPSHSQTTTGGVLSEGKPGRQRPRLEWKWMGRASSTCLKGVMEGAPGLVEGVKAVGEWGTSVIVSTTKMFLNMVTEKHSFCSIPDQSRACVSQQTSDKPNPRPISTKSPLSWTHENIQVMKNRA